MNCIRLAALACLLVASNVLGQDSVVPPSVAPQWVVAVAEEGARISMTFPTTDDPDTEVYTVNVPFQETAPDGKVQMKFRSEIRVRKKKPGEPVRPKIIHWRMQDVKIMDLAGMVVDASVVNERLSRPTPVMAVTDAKVDPFFAQILKPDTLVVVIPARGDRR